MPRAILLRVDGSIENVIVPETFEDHPNEIEALFGTSDYYLTTLISDYESEQTIFLLMDNYNDFHRGQQPPLNAFIAENSEAKIYGDVIVYASEPSNDESGDVTYDLNLTVDDLKSLMKSITINDRGLFTGLIEFDILEDKDKRAEIGQILEKVGIYDYVDT